MSGFSRGPTGGEAGPAGPQGPAGPTIDQFLQSIYNWTGSQPIAANGWLNFFSLAGMTEQPNGTLGGVLGNNVLKFPAKTKWSGVVFNVRLTGTVSGGPSADPRDWRIQMRRPDGTTVIGSDAQVKISGNDITNRDSSLVSYTFSITDPFTVNGVQLGLHNVMTGNTITLTSISVRVQRIINPD